MSKKFKSAVQIQKLKIGSIGFCLFIFCFVVFSVQAQEKSGAVQTESGLSVYLPREITIETETVVLGQVGIIQGSEDLVAKAGQVGLGRFSLPGQTIVLDKQVVLGRLLSKGIPAGRITFKGAEQITIKRKNCVISGSELISQAKMFLGTRLSSDSTIKWNLAREPAELIIAGSSDNIKYNCELINNNAKNQVGVEITVYSGKEKLGTRNVTFAAQYVCRNAVTITDISAGETIGPENVKIETTISSQPEQSGWTNPYGRTAKRALSAGTVIRAGMIESSEPVAVIKRNQNVAIRIEQPGFVISASGKALEDGKVDELIKVRNVDSQRVIVAKIRKDLSVEPVF
jgi:flagellar basal body P-ring formation protein FlgA